MNSDSKKDVVLSAQGICKTFVQGKQVLNVLISASLTLHRGEIVSLVGQSGSGKSTFLQIIGLLDQSDSGDIIINGMSCFKASDTLRTRIRLESIGVVYQYHHLLPEFSAVENVMLPYMLAGKTRQEAYRKASEMLGHLGLSERITHRPAELSGGEQQRVAIARAMINQPAILLADEPTGNLDPDTAKSVYQLLLKSARDYGIAVLFVTHNMELAVQADRQMLIKEGHIVEG